jgi:predicted Zn-dependent peptidase
MEFQYHTLENGLRIVHFTTVSEIAHCGIMVNIGSRDEEEQEHGMAHFIEHAIFKGTKHRKPYHIISRLEDVGGDLNAYTTKEETVIHASFLREYYPRTIELMSDILFNSVFPEKEIEKEKEIIIDEINSYLDSPAEAIFDDFEEMIYRGNAIGRNILGTPTHLKSFTRLDILNFMKKNYHPSQMVFCSTGDIAFNKLIKLAETYLSYISPSNTVQKRKNNFKYKAQVMRIKKTTFQAHCIIGNMAYGLKDNRRVALYLLSNILGGPGMNSRLNLSLREKSGYSYNIESLYTPYTDSGSLAIYFGTDTQNIERSLDLVHKEFKKIRLSKLGSLQLSRAKKQFIGQLAIAAENNEGMMLSAGKSMMVYGKVDEPKHMYKRINKLSSSEIIEVANEILAPENLSLLIYQSQ